MPHTNMHHRKRTKVKARKHQVNKMTLSVDVSQLYPQSRVARVARMDVCVPQRGFPFTKAYLAATYSEHAASQVQAMPTAHKPLNVANPWPDQLTT